MCQVASDALREATQALLDADLARAEQVIASDVQLDEMRSNAENVALELLALEAPVATDLRTVVSAIWIVADMQRMGARDPRGQGCTSPAPRATIPAEIRPIIERMGRVGVHLADQAGVVLRERDLDLARQLEVEDDLMDDLQRELFAALLAPTGDTVLRPPLTSRCSPGSMSGLPTTQSRSPVGSSSWSQGRTSAETPPRCSGPYRSPPACPWRPREWPRPARFQPGRAMSRMFTLTFPSAGSRNLPVRPWM